MEDLTGKQFGPYQIIAPLGEGGMAAVYKAYQPSMDRYVALKVLPRHFADDPQFTSRFQREAKLLAQLQHPHILPVFDYGQAEGYSYIVMPFVQGGILMDSLKGQPLPLQQIRQVIIQVAGALNYAHSHGLIHRDVKPSNVLIDESGNYLLSDFGLARMVETSTNLTASGAIVGTPAYMSPEQGSGLKLDARSDIYSLGVILYEMATGRTPYKAETPIAVIIKHINDPLPPPRSVTPQLSEAMERAILKALAKNPEDRFQTAAEMIRAVEAASGSEAEVVSAQTAETNKVMDKTVSPTMQWRKIWETPRGKVALVSGLIVVLVLGLLVSRWSSPLQIPDHEATSSVANETDTPSQASLTNVPLTPLHTLAPTRTTSPTNTPNPLELGETLYPCGDDVCIGDKRVGLAETYFGFSTAWSGLSWSPDGSRFVFSACLKEDAVRNPNYQCEGNIYISDHEGNVTVVVTGPTSTRMPAWSPDGEWIVYEDNNSIVIIRPDGTGRKTIVGNRSVWLKDMVWSPDSQRIAWLEDRFFASGEPPNSVRVINRDGSDMQTLFQSTDPPLTRGVIAWSPDGESVAVMLQNGVVYSIDADCYNLPNGCDESSRIEIKEIPLDWLHNFYPQWISALNAAPTIAATPSSNGEAFFAPILATIADRPPDFVDDFSFAGNGWQSFESPYSSISDGVLKISVPAGEASDPGKSTSYVGENNSSLSGLDFVFQMDVRAKSLPPDSGTGIIFRFLNDEKTTSSPQGYFTFDLSPGLGEWKIVDHHTQVENPLIAQGKSNAVTLGQWMKIRIIARGSTFAVYLNDQPLSYFVNDLHPMGVISFFAGNGTGISAGDIQVEFDNVKFWNLENVPGLP